MENITFKYKNGKFIIVESYGAVDEVERRGDVEGMAASSSPAPAAADSSEPEAEAGSEPEAEAGSEADTPRSPPNTIAKLLLSYGLSKEEILDVYRKFQAWGSTGAGSGTTVVFDNTKLIDGIDDELRDPESETAAGSESGDTARFETIIAGMKDVIGDGEKAREIVDSFREYFESLRASTASTEEPAAEPASPEPATPATATESFKISINKFKAFLNEGQGSGAATAIVNNFLNTKYKEFAKPEVASVLVNFISKNFMKELPKLATGIKSASLGTAQADLKQKLKAKQDAKKPKVEPKNSAVAQKTGTATDTNTSGGGAPSTTNFDDSDGRQIKNVSPKDMYGGDMYDDEGEIDDDKIGHMYQESIRKNKKLIRHPSLIGWRAR